MVHLPTVLLVAFPSASLIAAEVGELTGGDYGMIERGGIIGALFLAVVGFMRGWWVPGYLYRQTETERARLLKAHEDLAPTLTRVGDALAAKVRARDE